MRKDVVRARMIRLLSRAMVLAAALVCTVAGRAGAQQSEPLIAGRLWADIDYLMWNVSGDKLPPLVTTGMPPQSRAGALGAPATGILVGNTTVNEDWRSGGRITAGYFLDAQHGTSIELNFFELANATTRFSASSGSSMVLARPFLDANTGLQNSQLIAFPGLLVGSVNASDTSRLLGGSALYRVALGSWGPEHVSALIGYRMLYEADRLAITGNSTVTGGGFIPVGTQIVTSDAFNATNYFHGIDVGIAGGGAEGPWRWEWRALLGLGADINGADINGSSGIATAGIGTGLPGGLLALPSNIGDHTQLGFGVVPELMLKGGYEFAPDWQAIAGYDLIFWTGVQRAGALVDTTVNPNLIPPAAGGGPQRPRSFFSTTSLLAQGFSLGIKHDF
jgi:hypothetical protein